MPAIHLRHRVATSRGKAFFFLSRVYRIHRDVCYTVGLLVVWHLAAETIQRKQWLVIRVHDGTLRPDAASGNVG